MTEKHKTEGLKTNSLKTFISSKESSWFWLSLLFIFTFFIFSWIASENVLVLFIKRATALIFAFLVPGYVITKAIYPRRTEINVIEELAFSIGFSITFIISISYFLNLAWEITHFSLAITTFLFALIFAFIALLRNHHKNPKTKNNGIIEESTIKDVAFPLFIIGVVAFILNSYDSATSPILGASDPYGWKYRVDSIIQSESIPQVLFPGYPWGFGLFTTFLTIFLDISAYDTMRYIPAFSFLNIVPTYLLTYHIFRSVRISLLAAVFMMSTKFIFQYASIAVPQMMIHFLFILFLFMLLKTLEDTSIKNIFATSLILASNMLVYHFEMIILVLFLPLIFIIIAAHNRLQKKPNRELLKCGFILGLSSTLIAGFLWYFWQLGPVLAHYSGQYSSQSITKVAKSFWQPEFYMYIVHDGWALTLLSAIGLLFIFSKPGYLKEIRYQFLIIYLVTILLIIEFFIPILVPHMQFLTADNPSIFNTSSYFFAYLTLPLAILASYGLFNIIKNVPGRGGLYAPILTVIFLLNVNSFNYYYPPEESTTYELDKELDQGNYNSLFFFKYYWDKPITEQEYDAFEWLRENMPPDSRVIYWWRPYRTYGQRICECDALPILDLNISDSPSTEIAKKTYQLHSDGINIYVLTGLLHDRLAIRFAMGNPDFSNETLDSIAADPNFRLVYQNPQIKIYRIEFDNYTVLLDKPGGFRGDFVDLFYWGNNLNENNTLSIKKGIVTYHSKTDNQPIDTVFSSGIDTRIYNYFETRMRVDSGKISIGVYDSTGDVHTFLNNFTTNGRWMTYKFNLYDWLARNGYGVEVHGIKITNALEGDPFFSAAFDWVGIHNHIFWDTFEDGSNIVNMDNISVANANVTLSVTTAELISNSGFENGFEGWRPNARWSIDSEKSHAGDRSAVLRGAVDPASDSGAYLDTEVYRAVIKPNTIYRFSAWITGNVTDAVRGDVRQFGSVPPWSEWIYLTTDNTIYNNWTHFEGIVTMPDDVTGAFWIRIYGGGNPTFWIDDVSFGEDIYESFGTLTSTTTITENPIISVTPVWTSTESDGKNITLEISVDNGTTWTLATNGVPINYTASDSNRHLLYKASFRTNDVHQSPILHDITLTYEEQLPTQHPVEFIIEEPIEPADVNAYLISDFKLSKYKVKRGEVVEITYTVKNIGPSVLDGHLAIDDVKIGDESIRRQLFTEYPKMPYKIGYGETASFEQTYTIRPEALPGRYEIWRAMWDENMKTWVAPVNMERQGFKVEMEVV